MGVTKRRHFCFWSTLLMVTAAACVYLIYICLRYEGRPLKVNTEVSVEKSMRSEKLSDEQCIPVCDTKECVLQANMLLKSMDPSFDPCEKFDSFLCEEFRNKFGHDEPGNMMSGSKTLMLNTLKGIIENLQAKPGSASEKMRMMYDSCMDYGSSELRGVKTLKELLNDFGILNWPNLDPDFKFIDTNKAKTLGSLKAYGTLEYLFFRLRPKKEEESELDERYVRVLFSINLFNASSDIPRQVGVHSLEYFDLGEEGIETLLNDYEAVRNSILDLDESSLECEENCTDVNINCSEHNTDDWSYFCQAVEVFLSTTHLNDQVNKNLIIIEGEEAVFLKNFFPLLNSLSDRSVANFYALSFLWRYLEELNFYFRLTKQKYHQEQNEENQTQDFEKWIYCVQWISENMKYALQNEFSQQYLTKAVSEEINEICQEHAYEISDLLTLQDWIEPIEKSKIANFTRNMKTNIFNLNQLLPNETYVNEYYKMFHPTAENFFQNVLQFKRAVNDISWQLALKLDEAAMFMTNFEVQASATSESIDLHFGILFPPFYLPNLKRLLNNILFAPIHGHEIGHTILFMTYSADDTDNNQTLETLEEKMHCIENQFSKFKFKILDENLNGSLYSVENLPDNIATTLVDKLISKYLPQEAILLPGLPYSTEQLLYMISSRIWCSKENLKEEMHYKTENNHAPHGFRLIGTMQNSRGFSNAFHCPDGSFMNPMPKCSLLDVT